MATDTQRNSSQVRTLTPQMTSPRWLGSLGHCNGLNYGFIYPGGCNAMSITLGRSPRYRTDAIDPGRIAEIWRGASKVWEGIIDESVPGDSGWSITAHGSGTYGTSFMIDYDNYTVDNIVDKAISRGLRWTKPVFGTIGYLDAAAPAENHTVTVTDFLNSATIQAGLLWNSDVRQNNLLSIAPPPSAVDRLLICTVPNPRTLSAGVNRIWYKFVASEDANLTQVITYASVSLDSMIKKHGAMEQTVDLTPAGVMTSQNALMAVQNVLNQYVSSNYSSTFNVRHGQYLTIGGSPVDLGCETAYPHVARLLITDGSYGGEVTATPVTFAVGEYAYDDDTQTAQVTPYQSYKTSLSGLLTKDIPALRQ